MGLTDQIRVLAVAASAVAMMTCSSGNAIQEPLVLEQEVTAGVEAESPTIEGDVLEFAVQQSFFHEGRMEYTFIDLISEDPTSSRRDYEAQFFITTQRHPRRGTLYVGVIHLRDESHEMDIMVRQSGGFPGVAPGNAPITVHYHEFDGPHYRFEPVVEQRGIVIRGGPESLGDEDAMLMFRQFLTMYNGAIDELYVQNRIMDDYQAHQAEQSTTSHSPDGLDRPQPQTIEDQ